MNENEDITAELDDFAGLDENINQAVALMKALSNRHRLMILCLLQEGELSVSEINERISIPQSTLSQHLAWLRTERFVKTRREAQTIFYSLDSEEVVEVITVLHRMYCSQ